MYSMLAYNCKIWQHFGHYGGSICHHNGCLNHYVNTIHYKCQSKKKLKVSLIIDTIEQLRLHYVGDKSDENVYVISA